MAVRWDHSAKRRFQESNLRLQLRTSSPLILTLTAFGVHLALTFAGPIQGTQTCLRLRYVAFSDFCRSWVSAQTICKAMQRPPPGFIASCGEGANMVRVSRSKRLWLKVRTLARTASI